MFGRDRPSGADVGDSAGGGALAPGPDDVFAPVAGALPKIVAAALIGALLGLGVKAAWRPTFSSTAQILIEPSPAKDLPADLSPTPVDSNSQINFVESQMGVITSTPVLLRALHGIDPNASGAAESAALAGLQRSLAVTRADRSLVVDVTAKAATPQDSARNANAVVDAYVSEDSDSRARAAKQLAATLDARIADLRKALREAEDKATAFKGQNGLEGAHDPKLLQQGVANSSAALAEADTRAAQAQARLKQLSAAPKDLSAVVALGEDPQSRKLSLALEAQRAAHAGVERLQGVLGDRHPDLVNARQQADEADRRVAADLAEVRRALQAQANTANAERAALKARVDAQSGEISQSGAAQRQLESLESAVDSSRKALDAFETRAREAMQTAQLAQGAVRIVAAARAPSDVVGLFGYASWALAGAVAAALAAIGFFMLRAAIVLEPRIDALERHVLPRAPRPNGLSAGAPEPSAYLQDEFSRTPEGAFAKAVDALHKELAAKESGSVLVTATRKGAGRSTLAANLARAAGAAGRRVLLIDANGDGAYAAMAEAPADVVTLMGRERPAYRVPGAQGEVYVTPLVPDVEASLAQADVRARLHPMRRADFDCLIIDGPLTDAKDAAGLAEAADAIVHVGASGLFAASPAAVAKRLGIDPAKVTHVLNRAA